MFVNISCQQLLILFVSIHYTFSLTNRTTITYNWGRIDNIANQYIDVTASASITKCIRACAEYSLQNTFEDCYGYNYDRKTSTCELIHSTEPLEIIISFDTRWNTGIKSYT